MRIGRRDGWSQGVQELIVKQPEGVVPGFHSGASYLEHLAMQRTIREGTKSEVTLQDGLRAVAVGQAAHLSIAEKRPVDISELFR